MPAANSSWAAIGWFTECRPITYRSSRSSTARAIFAIGGDGVGQVVNPTRKPGSSRSTGFRTVPSRCHRSSKPHAPSFTTTGFWRLRRALLSSRRRSIRPSVHSCYTAGSLSSKTTASSAHSKSRQGAARIRQILTMSLPAWRTSLLQTSTRQSGPFASILKRIGFANPGLRLSVEWSAACW